MIPLAVAVILILSLSENRFPEADVPAIRFEGESKLGALADMLIKTSFHPETSDESIRIMQPNQTVLEGVVTFRIEQRHASTGAIRDVKREVLLRVQPKDIGVQGDARTYTMKIVDRTILDLPNQAIFLDRYESDLDTTVFHDGWHTIEIIYLEDGKEVDSLNADFHFHNIKEPSPETSTARQVVTETTTVEAGPTTPIVTETITILILVGMGSLMMYAYWRKKRNRIQSVDEGPSQSL